MVVFTRGYSQYLWLEFATDYSTQYQVCGGLQHKVQSAYQVMAEKKAERLLDESPSW